MGNDLTEIKKRLNKIEEDIKRLKQSKNIIRTESYQNIYFKNEKKKKELIERLNENIALSGINLELKTFARLSKHGYYTQEFFYEGDTTKEPRQIDFVASKKIEFKYGDTLIQFVVNLIGDCKYRSQIDILFFENNFNWFEPRLPLPINPDLIPKLFENISKKPLISNKITQLKISGYLKDKEHLSDNQIHDSIKQLMSATKHLKGQKVQRYTQLSERLKNKSFFWSGYKNEIELNSKDFDFTTYAHELLRKKGSKTFLAGIDFLRFECIIPLIVFDETRGVMKAKLDKKFDLKDVEDIKYGIYMSGDEEIQYTKEDEFMPVILCNLEGLSEICNLIDDYLKKYPDYFKSIVKKFPVTLLSNFHSLTNE